MIRQIETKSIPVDLIEVGHRHQQPTERQIESIAKSIEQDGLLTPIGVRADGDNFRLVCGATRLSAVKKLGWSEIRAVVFEGAAEEFETAELVENLERRHLSKDQQEEWTKKLVEFRAKAIRSDPQKELNDKLSFNSSQEPNTHPKTKIDGAKRGRPVTAEARAKKQVAAETGQSIRSVQRATTAKPKAKPTPNKKAIDHDKARMQRADEIERLLQEISKHLSACNRTDREMIRKNNKPYLDGWFGSDGKLRSELVVVQPASVGVASISQDVPDLTPEDVAA